MGRPRRRFSREKKTTTPITWVDLPVVYDEFYGGEEGTPTGDSAQAESDFDLETARAHAQRRCRKRKRHDDVSVINGRGDWGLSDPEEQEPSIREPTPVSDDPPTLPRATLASWQNSIVSANWRRMMPARRQPSPPTATPSTTEIEVTRIVALDCEMVGGGKDGSRDLLARVSVVNAHGQILLNCLVLPTEPVTDYRTRITGLRAHDFTRGIPFTEAQKRVSDLLTGRTIIGHDLKHDFKVLLLNFPRHLVRDTAKYRPLRQDPSKKPSLQQLAQRFLVREIQLDTHDSVEDARAALDVYKRVAQEWEQRIRRRRGRGR